MRNQVRGWDGIFWGWKWEVECVKSKKGRKSSMCGRFYGFVGVCWLLWGGGVTISESQKV